MAVFRVERNTGYTVMSNHHLRNKELSLKKMVHTGAEAVPVCILLILEKGGEICRKRRKNT